ncbi:MAG: hypothetical protein L3J16_05895 [Anaerolineales bacterium]|nr:hypothetical protein [Anaerolineales bacterium]
MEILGIALLVPLGGITIIALFAALTLLLPAPIEKTRNTLEIALGRSLLLGVVNFTFFIILALGFFWISQNSGEILGGIFIFLAALILLGLAIFGIIGLTASANLLGERIGGEKTPFASYVRGGALLLLAALAPYVGWFLFTPLILWAGLGAAISALVRKRKTPELSR